VVCVVETHKLYYFCYFIGRFVEIENLLHKVFNLNSMKTSLLRNLGRACNIAHNWLRLFFIRRRVYFSGISIYQCMIKQPLKPRSWSFSCITLVVFDEIKFFYEIHEVIFFILQLFWEITMETIMKPILC
jgi:hypothetical protein